MRITIPISSNGERWHPDVPRIDLMACYPENAGFDEVEFRRQIRECRGIQMSSADCGSPCAFAAILLASIRDWMEDNDKSETATGVARTIERLKTREARGLVSYVRIDISSAIVPHKGHSVRGVRVDIRHDDHGVQQHHDWDYEFAMLVTDFVREFSARGEARGEPAIKMTERVLNLMQSLHAVREEEDARQANERRLVCANHRNGYCSPCNPGCKHFKNGKCEEI